MIAGWLSGCVVLSMFGIERLVEEKNKKDWVSRGVSGEKVCEFG